MNKIKYVSIIEIAKELNLYVKIVTSVNSFASYNSYYNIYDESDEPCRRILVLTPYEALEEVNDFQPDTPILNYKLVDGNIWIKDYPLTVAPDTININDLKIDKVQLENLINNK